MSAEQALICEAIERTIHMLGKAQSHMKKLNNPLQTRPLRKQMVTAACTLRLLKSSIGNADDMPAYAKSWRDTLEKAVARMERLCEERMERAELLQGRVNPDVLVFQGSILKILTVQRDLLAREESRTYEMVRLEVEAKQHDRALQNQALVSGPGGRDSERDFSMDFASFHGSIRSGDHLSVTDLSVSDVETEEA